MMRVAYGVRGGVMMLLVAVLSLLGLSASPAHSGPVCGWQLAADDTGPGTPGPRLGAQLAFEPFSGQVILFGGYRYLPAFEVLNDTWSWDGSQWTPRAASAPGVPFRAAVAAGPALAAGPGGVFLFGGSDPASGQLRSATWRFDGTNWVIVPTPTSPPGREHHAMAYDAARQVIVLFGGEVPGAGSLDDTWEFDGATWTERAAAGPSARSGHSMAYDPSSASVILQAGYSFGQYSSETWRWNGASWTPLTGSGGPYLNFGQAMAYSSRAGAIIACVGTAAWAFRNDFWAVLPGDTLDYQRYELGLAYDEIRQRLVLFGGYDFNSYRGDTWEWREAGVGIVQQPPPFQSVDFGGVTQLQVFAIGEVALSYEWRKDGVPLTDDGRITGSHSPKLSIASAQIDDTGVYDCEVTGPSCGAAVSYSAYLLVTCPFDTNHDGVVDFLDLNGVLSYFGGFCAP